MEEPKTSKTLAPAHRGRKKARGQLHDSASTLPVHLVRSGCRPYCLKGTSGAAILSGLFRDGDEVIEKQLFSAFAGTPLGQVVAQTPTLVIAGVATDCCVLTTAFDAATTYRKDVYIPYQAVAASAAEAFAYGLDFIAKSAGAVVDLDHLLARGEPSWADRIHPDVLPQVALERFRQQQQELAALLAEIPDLRSRPVEEAVAILEKRLC